MPIAQSIVKLGFKRWYERQLIESHAYLITCILCMVLVATCLEHFSFRAPGIKPILMLALSGGGGLLALFSWRRYRSISAEAERLVYHSTCKQCGAYAKFDVLESGGSDGPSQIGDGTPNTWLRVRCKKCGHGWTMP